MTIWIMFAIIVLNGEPQVTYLPYQSQDECVAAKTELTKELIEKYGGAKTSITCFEAKIGDAV